MWMRISPLLTLCLSARKTTWYQASGAGRRNLRCVIEKERKKERKKEREAAEERRKEERNKEKKNNNRMYLESWNTGLWRSRLTTSFPHSP